MSEIAIPPGVIAVTTYGPIRAETAASLLEMRAFAEGKGLKNIHWTFVYGNLVDKTRNEAVQALLASQGQWLWFIDADMQFAPDLIEHMLLCAFGTHQDADIVGGWCPLRGEPYLPTIDRGSGTWEPTDAGSGPVEVIRTGGACLLVKRRVFEHMEYPWFGVRHAGRPLDAMCDLDGFARQRFDGRNPFEKLPEWRKLFECARESAAQGFDPKASPGWNLSTVGEDSAFCDKAKALGFKIVVQTNAVCNHVDRKIITPADHASAMKALRAREKAASGIV